MTAFFRLKKDIGKFLFTIFMCLIGQCFIFYVDYKFNLTVSVCFVNF